MIAREDAISRLRLEFTPEFESRITNVIDAIYDSIGTCGECTYYTRSGDCHNSISMAYGGHNSIEEDNFCADFEREENR